MGLDVTGRFRYPPPNPEWLQQSVEDVLMPSLPIIDAHHHLWEQDGRPYLLDEITADVADGHALEATVFVQAHYGYRTDGPAHLAPIGETEKVMAIRGAAAAQSKTKIAAGIVAFADMTLGDQLAEVLGGHAEVAGFALKGIRHSVSRDENFPDGIVLRPAPAGLMGSNAYRAGLKLVQQRGLVYDAMLYHSQMDEVIALARDMPDLPIVLDHIGCILGVGPYRGREREVFAEWRRDIRVLAQFPNVTIKIGGFGMIVCGARWHEQPLPPSSEELSAAWKDYIDVCIDAFGADRCMFESNFPVDKAMYSYRTLWNAFKRTTQFLSEDERASLFSETARRVYCLPSKEAQHG